MSHEHIGYARFGKLDGFQWIEKTGIMGHFRRPEDVSTLSQALALRQEAIRMYAGEKILGLTHLTSHGHQYRFITSYSYRLDRYKRDGYMAVSLALKEIKVKARDILDCLEELEKTDPGEADQTVLRPFSQKLVGWPVAFSCPSKQNQATAFVTLPDWSSCEQLLAAACEGLFNQYQWIYASDGERTCQGVDTNEVDILRLSASGKKIEADIPETESLSKVPKNSLVYAFESGQEDQWGKQKSKNMDKSKSGFGLHALKRFFGG
ncbi:MAG: hypothetical protein AAF587_40860 [Bacteroidota bacterium]